MADWTWSIGPWKAGASAKTQFAGRGGGPEVELKTATTRRIQPRLLDPSTASFTVNGTGPDAAVIEELISDLWVYRDGVQVMRGRVVGPTTDTGNEDGARATTVEVTDYRGVLDRRLLYADRTWTNVEQATIVWDLISDTQGQPGGAMGIVQDTYPSAWTPTGVVRPSVTFSAGDSIWQSIKKLGAMNNGFEFDIDMNLAAHLYYPQRGVDGGEVLDYGGLVASFSRVFDPASYANAVRQSGADGVTASTVTVPGISGAAEGRWDAQFSDTALNTAQMVADTATSNLARVSRLFPVYTVTLARGAWRGPGHIWVGDWVSTAVNSGRVDEVVKARVYEMTIDIDSEGVEKVSMQIGGVSIDARSVLRGIARRVNQALQR